MSPPPDRYSREYVEDALEAELQGTPRNRCLPVAEGYERWAPNYDNCPNPLLSLEERQLRCMLPPLKGRRVLDLACGTGRWLVWMLSQGASRGVGVDFSKEMLAATQQKPALRHRLVQADCRALPFAAEEFDLVIFSFAVGHIRDLNRVIREIGRVTAAGADVYVSDLHPLAYAQGWQTGFRDERGSVEIVTWPRSVQELLAAWTSRGFDCVQSVECRITEAERPIFARTGKASLFEGACRIPAVLLSHFTRPMGQ